MKRLIPLALLAAPPAHAFTLLTGSGIVDSGWQTDALAFDYDYSQCPAGVGADQLNAAFAAAIQLWNGVPTADLKLSQGAAVTTSFSEQAARSGESGIQHTPVIFCDPAFGADFNVDSDYVLGLAQSYFDGGGRAYLAYIGLNADAGRAANIANSSPTQLSIVFAHEMGHVLGLGHSPEVPALMHFDLSTKTALNLAKDDADGVSYLYPRQEAGASKAFGCGTIAAEGPRRHDGSDHDGGAAARETGLLFAALTLIWALTPRASRKASRRRAR